MEEKAQALWAKPPKHDKWVKKNSCSEKLTAANIVHLKRRIQKHGFITYWKR